MKTNSRRDFLKLAGAAMVGATGVASAAENPFGFKQMDTGYSQVASNHMEGKCGEGKCGGSKKPKAEGSCGGKMKEGSCGGKKKEGSCGGKMKEGSCGGKKTEGSCGGKMKEGKCGVPN
jgi:uncharacterized low-complexity protein